MSNVYWNNKLSVTLDWVGQCYWYFAIILIFCISLPVRQPVSLPATHLVSQIVVSFKISDLFQLYQRKSVISVCHFSFDCFCIAHNRYTWFSYFMLLSLIQLIKNGTIVGKEAFPREISSITPSTKNVVWTIGVFPFFLMLMKHRIFASYILESTSCSV